jgi:hypothetical protein
MVLSNGNDIVNLSLDKEKGATVTAPMNHSQKKEEKATYAINIASSIL